MTAGYAVEVRRENARGCGYRKPGKNGVGVYLVGSPFTVSCALLPWPIRLCPTCGCGVKASRAWGWIDPGTMFVGATEREDTHPFCFVQRPPEGKHGLVWVGGSFYPTPEAFLSEANRMGISRKLPAVPRGFEPGKTVVYLAHRKTPIPGSPTETMPAIIGAFRPVAVELVIDNADRVPAAAKKLKDRFGDFATIVQVERLGEQIELSVPDSQNVIAAGDPA